MGIANILFLVVFAAASWLFAKNLKRIVRNIKLGKDLDRSDNSAARWKTMIRVALGQSKMVVRPVAGILHILVYVGFVIINIEMIEIIIDGIFGTHRFLHSILPASLYNFLIASFEVLALLVLVSCIIFLIRRNIIKIKRFWKEEMKGWPKTDANLILIFEVLLMSAFLFMNAADMLIQDRGESAVVAGSFPVSSMLAPLISHLETSSLVIIERACWWFHIVGILGFMNYLVVSKHLHILFAFPNTYYSKLEAKGQFTNMASVTSEVKMMLDPNADPFAAPANDAAPERFGAKDITDLNWVQLMNAYTCTECGRCTSECPANLTGKKLSPRKIMMDVRDRVEEYAKGIDANGQDHVDGKSLLNDYISPEEIWACTSCNACTQACPVNIDPLSIIVDLRRYLVMEESAAPTELNMMFTNIENNGAPWQFPAADRLNWKDE
jgi:heterodisulfide reductase subunit C